METVTIDINNPTAKKLLQNLADLNLITIRKSDRSVKLKKALSKLRDKSELMPDFNEITMEVEKVRAARSVKKNA